MFKEKTVFILGAGASCPYGYPIGKNLIKDILKDMDDKIFLPENNAKFGQYISKEGTLYQFSWWKNFKDIEVKPAQTTEDTPYFLDDKGMCHNLIEKCSIKGISEFKKLYEALVQFDPVSIDAFLRDNPSLGEAGKTMIVYSLLKREDKSKFSMPERKEAKKEERDNWYSYFLNDLASDCADNTDKFLEKNTNNLNIITFNYDVSLDFYIKDRLKKIEVFNKEDKIADQFLEKFKIDHVYGNVGNQDNKDEYGFYFADYTEKTESTFKRFLTSIRRLEQIKTMHDERGQAPNEKVTQYFNQLKEARNIIFIGFGFDRDNLNQLGLPSIWDEWSNKFLPGKIIKWLNYRDNMTGLSGQFNRIGSNVNIIESKADNIVTAYQNDFKASLF